jgi:hypothetical protein
MLNNKNSIGNYCLKNYNEFRGYPHVNGVNAITNLLSDFSDCECIGTVYE